MFLRNAVWLSETDMIVHMDVTRDLGFSETVPMMEDGGRKLTTSLRVFLRTDA